MKRFYLGVLLAVSVMLGVGTIGCDKSDPRNAEDLIKSGKLFLDMNDHKRAITDLTKALGAAKTSEDSTMAYALRMLAHARKGDYKKAVEDLYNWFGFESGRIVSVIDGADPFSMDGVDDEKRAKELLTALDLEILQRPKNSEAYIIRSLMYLGRGDSGDDKKAIDDLNRAVLMRPKDANAYVFLAMMHIENDDTDKAMAALNEAIRLNSKHIGAYLFRAAGHSSNDNYDRALADFNEVIRLAPKNATLYKMRGELYEEKDDYEKAIADYSEALRIVNADPNADTNVVKDLYGKRGAAYRANGDFERAVTDLGLGMGSGMTVDDLINLGRVTGGDMAIVYYGLALQKDRGNTSAQRLLRRAIGDALRDNHKHTDALKALGLKILGTEVTPTKEEKITIVNNTGYRGRELYITNNDNYLGEDKLGADFLNNNQTFTFELPYPTSDVNKYTIVLVDTDGDRYIKRNVTVRDGSRITFTFGDMQ